MFAEHYDPPPGFRVTPEGCILQNGVVMPGDLPHDFSRFFVRVPLDDLNLRIAHLTTTED